MTDAPQTQMFDLFAPGTMLGRNELLATIGEGGMARVILARQRGPMGFEKVVVVKVIHPRLAEDQAAVGMLLDEARVAAQINHPHVVQTYELGEAHGSFFVVMEYLAGESLQRILKTATLGVSLDPRMAARIVADAADGLHAAHELQDVRGRNLGLVHRDVSLGNIVVLYNGCVKVVDFGIAKTIDRVSTTTQAGQLKGKYAYMSPEQVHDQPLDRRTDVFSLGVVLWETLALRRLFHSESVPGTLMQILDPNRTAPSTYRPEVPRELDAIALQALAVNPDDRFQTALEMKRALEDVIWESRCDASDIGMYMTAVFGDRIRKRQKLLSSATTHHEVVLEPRDVGFDDTSGISPPRRSADLIDSDAQRRGVLIDSPGSAGARSDAQRRGVLIDSPGSAGARSDAQRRGVSINPPQRPSAPAPPHHAVSPPQLPPLPPAMHPLPRAVERPARRKRSRKLVATVIALGLAGGVALGIPIADEPKPVAAGPAVAPIAPPAPARVATVDRPRAPTIAKTNAPDGKVKASDGELDTTELPQLRSKLRPEHLEPVRVEPELPAGHDPPKPPPTRPKKPDAGKLKELVAHAAELHLAGKFTEAVAVYKQALVLDKSNAAAHRGLGLVYQRMGFDAMAIEEYRRYLALVPGATDIEQRIDQLGGQE